MKLIMTSWEKGLQTVPLILAVRQYSTGSFILAKSEVERFLSGQAVELDFPSEAAGEEFKAKAESFGVRFSSD